MERYNAAFISALQMMDDISDLELTSALKQAGENCGIPYGEPMGEFVEWAYKKLGA